MNIPKAFWGTLFFGTLLCLSLPVRADEVIRLVPGRDIEVTLSPDQPRVFILFQTGVSETLRFFCEYREGVDSIETVFWEMEPDGSEQALTGGVISTTSDLAFSRTVDPTKKYRLALRADSLTGMHRVRLSVSGFDHRGRAFLIRNATELAVYSSSGPRELGRASLQSDAPWEWSPDGEYLLTGSTAWAFWRVYPALEKIGEGTAGDPTFLFVPDSDVFVVADAAVQRITLIRYPDMDVLGDYEGTSAALLPVSDRLVIFGGPFGLIVEPETGVIVAQWPSRDRTDATWCPDGSYVAFQDIGQATASRVQLVRTSDGALVGQPVEFSSLRVVQFSPDSRKMVLSGIVPNDSQNLHRTRIFSTGTREQLGNEIVLNFPLRVKLGPESRLLAMIPDLDQNAGFFQIYDMEQARLLNRFFGFNRIGRVLFHPEGRSLLVQGLVRRDGLDCVELKLIDGQTARQLWQSNPLRLDAVDYNFSGNRFVMLGLFTDDANIRFEEVQLRDSITGALVRPAANERDWLSPDWDAVEFTPDGKRLINQVTGRSYGVFHTFFLWDSATGSRLNPPPYGDWIFFGLQNYHYSPDSSSLLVFRADEIIPPSIRFLNLRNGGLVRELHGFRSFGRMVSSSDGNRVAFSFVRSEETLARIGVATFQTASVIQSNPLDYLEIQEIAWSHDGQLLLVNGLDAEGRGKQSLLDASTLARYADYDHPALGVAFDRTRPPLILDYDLNRDGRIDRQDIFLLQKEWDPLYPEVGYGFWEAYLER